MDWFSTHPNWLYDEALALSQDSIYKQQFQEINRTFVSTGEILVHKEKTQRFPIFIAYPDATPYAPPVIFLLEKPLSREEVKDLSARQLSGIAEELRPKVKFLDNRRHQNPDGSVCFVEMGDLHGDQADFHGISDIIKRIRFWLSGDVPPDSPEAELFFHFHNRAVDLEYILPDLFYDDDWVQGEFSAAWYPFQLKNPADKDPTGEFPSIYFGATISGQTALGISALPRSAKDRFASLFTVLRDPIKLLEQAKKNEADEKTVMGYWWEVDTEPLPFATVAELARVIGAGDEDKGFARMLETAGLQAAVEGGHDTIHVGLRFPGRNDGKDWLMLRLKRGSRPPLLGKGAPERVERLRDYALEAVYHETFTDSEFHKRNRGRADRSTLRDHGVSVIGCGALGSEVADCLAKAGVGTLGLVDNQKMRAHNALRHVLGVNHTGTPKAAALRFHLMLRNPFIDATRLWANNILQSAVTNYLPDGWVGLSTIADDNVEGFLNQQAVEARRTIFYARALRGGKAARIFRVIPGVDACKACLSLYRAASDPRFIDVPEDQDLPPITNECNNPIRPASAADLKIIAALASRILLDWIEKRSEGKNHWIWTMEPLKGIGLMRDATPAAMHAETIPPHPDCPVCQSLDGKRVIVSREVLGFMKDEAARSGKVETGGVLMGRFDGGVCAVYRASGPGPNAVRTENEFDRDVEYCQEQLDKAGSALGSNGQYVGEWHYHPRGTNAPSGQDLKSLMEIARQDNYHVATPVSIIISRGSECAVTLHDRSGRCVMLPLTVTDNPEENITRLKSSRLACSPEKRRNPMKFPDPYDRMARLTPAMLVLLPLVLAVAVVFPTEASGSRFLFTILGYCGFFVFLVQLARDLGVKKESLLFEELGGAPTIRLLRYRTAGNSETLSRYHTKLAQLITQLRLPTAEEEARDPSAADAVYESCVQFLKEQTRDWDKFHLVLVENMNYGFRRNLWAMKPLGILFSLIGTAGVSLRVIPSSPWFDQSSLGFSAICGTLIITLLAFWTISVTKDWVRLAADAYARRLLSSIERL